MDIPTRIELGAVLSNYERDTELLTLVEDEVQQLLVYMRAHGFDIIEIPMEGVVYDA